MTAQCAVRAAKRGCCTAPSIKWILHLIERNAFSSRPCGTPGRKRRKESIFALAGHALLRKNAPRSAQVAAADYTWRGCGPSKPPRGFRFPGIRCCSFFYENQYTCNTILNLKSYHLWVSFPSWRCFIPVNVALLRLPPFSLARAKNPSQI